MNRLTYLVDFLRGKFFGQNEFLLICETKINKISFQKRKSPAPGTGLFVVKQERRILKYFWATELIIFGIISGYQIQGEFISAGQSNNHLAAAVKFNSYIETVLDTFILYNTIAGINAFERTFQFST